MFGASLGGTERKTGTLFGSTAAPAGGLFGQSQQQNTTSQPSTGLFGSTTTQQPQNTSSLFGGSQQQNAGSSLFSNQQQQQAPQQTPLNNNSLFGGKLQPAPTLPQQQAQQLAQSQQGLPQLRQTSDSAFASSLLTGQREKSVVQQMEVIAKKWNPNDFEHCAFQHYFYNEVDPDQVPYYGPQPHEDEKKWEQALANKPGPGSIPVLATGFERIAARLQHQNLAVGALRTRLHEINACLTSVRNTHEFKISIRLEEARRKHIVHMQRTLALATNVQILRNRGYVMDQAEEELKKKLTELEKKTFDPVLGGRQEEIWARMSGVRERARILQEETEKLAKTVDGQQSGEVLSEEDQKQIEKLLKDYDKQLDHLKKWVDDTRQEYEEWEKDRKPPVKASSGR